VYRKLIAMEEELSVQTNRCRLFIAGEGRNGKTSTRKALTGRRFDPDEASTRGTEQQGVDLLNLKRTEASDWKQQPPCSVEHKRAIASLMHSVIAGTDGCTIETLRAMGVGQTLLGKIKEMVARRQAEAVAATSTAADDAKSATADDKDVQPAPSVLARKDDAQPLPAPPETDDAVQSVSGLDEEIEAMLKEYLETPSMAQPLHMQMWDFGGERPVPCHAPSATPALGWCALEPRDDLDTSFGSSSGFYMYTCITRASAHLPIQGKNCS